jgi:hypothetical protein
VELSTTLKNGTRREPGNEFLSVIAVWVSFSAIVLAKVPILFEADDYAYRASIVALKNGLITLSASQYAQLNGALRGSGQFGIYQWVHLADGSWISEKNPGFPFLAEPFYLLGNLRMIPVFYSLLAVTGLYLGARKWFGAGAGLVASISFLFSGASLAYANRLTMPTFTEACLVAAALGLLLWSCKSGDSHRARVVLSSLAFVFLGAAVFSRYTNAVIYVGVLFPFLVFYKRLHFLWGAVLCWMGVTASFATLILCFNNHFYGGWLKSGYSGQHFASSLSNFPKNISQITPFLLESMPVVLLALWGAYHLLKKEPSVTGGVARQRRVLGMVLVLSVVLPWGLYFGYDRTAFNLSSQAAFHVVRFYVPALGALALLATSQLMKIGFRLRVVLLVILVACSLWSFATLTTQVPPAPGQPGGAPLWSKVG